MPYRALLYAITQRRLRRFVAAGRFLALVVVLLSSIVLLARALASTVFPDSGFAAEPGMAISSAIALLTIAAYTLLQSGKSRRVTTTWRVPLALTLMAVATINALATLTAARWTVDRVLLVPLGAPPHLTMSPATALCVLLAAGCLLTPDAKHGRRRDFGYSLLAVTGLSVALLALTGYAFDSEALQEILLFSAMTFDAALGFFLLFASLLLMRPSWGWTRILAGPGPGSAQLRRALPFAFIMPFVFCWAALLAVELGILDVNIRLSILAMASMLCIAGLLFWSASRTNQDAAVIRKSNASLQKMVQERDVLLKEVYHRVKNNLQLLDAMLGIEAQAHGGGPLSERLESIRARVHAMGLVHQQLGAAEDLATVDLKDFLEELCAHQAAGAGLENRQIRLEVRSPSVAITLERAIPIALVVTELVANAIKHAFPNGQSGSILVAVEQSDGAGIVLAVSDNGVGSANGSSAPEQVGSLVVQSLASQLGATMEVRGERGYRVRLAIPLTAEIEQRRFSPPGGHAGPGPRRAGPARPV